MKENLWHSAVTMRQQQITVYLLWYRHDSDLQAPQFLSLQRKSEVRRVVVDRILINDTNPKQPESLTEMTIRELTLADSAVYYCALHTVIQSVEEAVQKPEHTDLPRLQRGGKWDSNHRFLSDGFWSFPVSSESSWLQLLMRNCVRIHMSSKSTSVTKHLDDASNKRQHAKHEPALTVEHLVINSAPCSHMSWITLLGSVSDEVIFC